jgi:hypothetical protein
MKKPPAVFPETGLRQEAYILIKSGSGRFLPGAKKMEDRFCIGIHIAIE